MAGYILAKFFFTRVYEPGRRLGTQTRKIKERGQYLVIFTEQAWSIKDLLYGQKKKTCGTQRVIPSRQISAILPARVANHSAGLGLSCPLTELTIY